MEEQGRALAEENEKRASLIETGKQGASKMSIKKNSSGKRFMAYVHGTINRINSLDLKQREAAEDVDEWREKDLVSHLTDRINHQEHVREENILSSISALERAVHKWEKEHNTSNTKLIGDEGEAQISGDPGNLSLARNLVNKIASRVLPDARQKTLVIEGKEEEKKMSSVFQLATYNACEYNLFQCIMSLP
jgi:hypothetical protein